jgi:ATP-binding cassette subfamily B protein
VTAPITDEPLDPGEPPEPTEPLVAGVGDDLDDPAAGGAVSVLRRGLAASPELRTGLALTVALAVMGAVGRITVPVLIQQILDRGVTGVDELQAGFVVAACAGALVLVGGIALLSRITYVRLVTAAEEALRALRVRAFARIHDLSVADHDQTRRGVLTARVTSDIETIARFAQWGGIAWIVNTVVIVGVVVVMAVYSWQLALISVVLFAPMLPIMRVLQRRQLKAYDLVRSRVGDTLSEVSESVMGASVVRAYGIEGRTRRQLGRAIDRQYQAESRAARFFALLFPLGDVFGGVVLASVVVAGVVWGPGWGLDVGSLVAFTFLVALVLAPIAELAEILDQTQTALAGWRKVLDVLDLPVDVAEPVGGATLPAGALAVAAEGVSFIYRGSRRPALAEVDVAIPAGQHVAVVGETGSGKTTFAKLLCRLADPTEGRLVVAGVDLRQVDLASRRVRVRLVPQDGFLFDATVRENVRIGRPDLAPEEGGEALDEATVDAEVRSAFDRLGLGWWVDAQPLGLDTPTGERGGQLSVGERQLVALARAQLADPGLLVLDEATSAVDPETEQALSVALERLGAGRTVVTIAHRLSTAEGADRVLVFDRGRLVQDGSHDELVSQPGRYRELHESWLGSTAAG